MIHVICITLVQASHLLENCTAGTDLCMTHTRQNAYLSTIILAYVTRQANIRGMNKVVVVFNIDTMSFEFKLNFSLGLANVFFEDAVLPQNRHRFAILILWVPASAISIPRNTSITDVNMAAAVTNNTSQIKIAPCTFFTDREQH